MANNLTSIWTFKSSAESANASDSDASPAVVTCDSSYDLLRACFETVGITGVVPPQGGTPMGSARQYFMSTNPFSSTDMFDDDLPSVAPSKVDKAHSYNHLIMTWFRDWVRSGYAGPPPDDTTPLAFKGLEAINGSIEDLQSYLKDSYEHAYQDVIDLMPMEHLPETQHKNLFQTFDHFDTMTTWPPEMRLGCDRSTLDDASDGYTQGDMIYALVRFIWNYRGPLFRILMYLPTQRMGGINTILSLMYDGLRLRADQPLAAKVCISSALLMVWVISISRNVLTKRQVHIHPLADNYATMVSTMPPPKLYTTKQLNFVSVPLKEKELPNHTHGHAALMRSQLRDYVKNVLDWLSIKEEEVFSIHKGNESYPGLQQVNSLADSKIKETVNKYYSDDNMFNNQDPHNVIIPDKTKLLLFFLSDFYVDPSKFFYTGLPIMIVTHDFNIPGRATDNFNYRYSDNCVSMKVGGSGSYGHRVWNYANDHFSSVINPSRSIFSATSEITSGVLPLYVYKATRYHCDEYQVVWLTPTAVNNYMATANQHNPLKYIQNSYEADNGTHFNAQVIMMKDGDKKTLKSVLYLSSPQAALSTDFDFDEVTSMITMKPEITKKDLGLWVTRLSSVYKQSHVETIRPYLQFISKYSDVLLANAIVLAEREYGSCISAGKPHTIEFRTFHRVAGIVASQPVYRYSTEWYSPYMNIFCAIRDQTMQTLERVYEYASTVPKGIVSVTEIALNVTSSLITDPIGYLQRVATTQHQPVYSRVIKAAEINYLYQAKAEFLSHKPRYAITPVKDTPMHYSSIKAIVEQHIKNKQLDDHSEPKVETIFDPSIFASKDLTKKARIIAANNFSCCMEDATFDFSAFTGIEPDTTFEDISASQPAMRQVFPYLGTNGECVIPASGSEAQRDATLGRLFAVNDEENVILDPNDKINTTVKKMYEIMFKTRLKPLDWDQLPEYLSPNSMKRYNHCQEAGEILDPSIALIMELHKQFVKKEVHMKLMEALKNRAISNVNDVLTIMLSRFTLQLAMNLKEVVPGYAFGQSSQELSRLIMRWAKMFTTFCETDFSAFDGTQNAITNYWGRLLYAMVFVGYEQEIDDICAFHVDVPFKAGKYNYTSLFTRLSGSADTSLGNTMINVTVALLAYHYNKGNWIEPTEETVNSSLNKIIAGGDDGVLFDMDPDDLETIARLCHMKIKVQSKSTTEPINMLARSYVNPQHSVASTPSLKRVITKLTHTDNTTLLAPEILFLKVASLGVAEYEHPLLQPFCLQLLRMISPYVCADVRKAANTLVFSSWSLRGTQPSQLEGEYVPTDAEDEHYVNTITEMTHALTLYNAKHPPGNVQPLSDKCTFPFKDYISHIPSDVKQYNHPIIPPSQKPDKYKIDMALTSMGHLPEEYLTSVDSTMLTQMCHLNLAKSIGHVLNYIMPSYIVDHTPGGMSLLNYIMQICPDEVALLALYSSASERALRMPLIKLYDVDNVGQKRIIVETSDISSVDYYDIIKTHAPCQDPITVHMVDLPFADTNITNANDRHIRSVFMELADYLIHVNETSHVMYLLPAQTAKEFGKVLQQMGYYVHKVAGKRQASVLFVSIFEKHTLYDKICLGTDDLEAFDAEQFKLNPKPISLSRKKRTIQRAILTKSSGKDFDQAVQSVIAGLNSRYSPSMKTDAVTHQPRTSVAKPLYMNGYIKNKNEAKSDRARANKFQNEHHKFVKKPTAKQRKENLLGLDDLIDEIERMYAQDGDEDSDDHQ